MLIRFYRSEEIKDEHTLEVRKAKTLTTHKLGSHLVDAYVLENDRILIITRGGYAVLDHKLKMLRVTDFRQGRELGLHWQLDDELRDDLPDFRDFVSFKPDKSNDHNAFLLTANEVNILHPGDRSTCKEFYGEHEEAPGGCFWCGFYVRNRLNWNHDDAFIARYTVNRQNKIVRAKHTIQKSALRLHYEVVQAADEYAKNKLLVVAYKKNAVGDNRFLLFDNLEFVREYWMPANWGLDMVGPSVVDTVALLPEFGSDFPWMLKAHSGEIYLLNLRNRYIKVFGETETASAAPQPAFFLVEEDYGFSLHFASKRVLANGTARLKWIHVRFPKEFLQVLKSDSILPENDP